MLHVGTELLHCPVAKQVIEELDPVISRVYPVSHEKDIVEPLRYCTLVGLTRPFDIWTGGQVTAKYFKISLFKPLIFNMLIFSL